MWGWDSPASCSVTHLNALIQGIKDFMSLVDLYSNSLDNFAANNPDDNNPAIVPLGLSNTTELSTYRHK